MCQIELYKYLLDLKPFNCVQIKLLVLDSNTLNHLINKEMSPGSLKSCYIQTIFVQIIFDMYMYQ